MRRRIASHVRDLYAETHRQLDRMLLPRVSEFTAGSQQPAALLLRIARNTLRRKIRELGWRSRAVEEAKDAVVQDRTHHAGPQPRRLGGRCSARLVSRLPNQPSSGLVGRMALSCSCPPSSLSSPKSSRNLPPGARPVRQIPPQHRLHLLGMTVAHHVDAKIDALLQTRIPVVSLGRSSPCPGPKQSLEGW